MKNQLPIFVCRIAICIFSVSMTMLSPLIVLIGSDFGKGISGSGFLYTAYYISNVFFCLVSGRIMNLLGKRNSMACGIVIFALTTFLFARVVSFSLACVLISIMGALATFIEAAGMAIVSDLSEDAAASNLSVTHAFAGVGAFVGVSFSGLMLSQGMNWRGIYTIFSIAAALVAVAFCVTHFPKMSRGTSGGFDDMVQIFTNTALYPSFLSLFLYVGAEAGITGWMATYMTRQLGRSPLEASLATGVIWLFVTAGRMVCSSLVKWYPLRRIVLALDTICILSIAISVTAHNEFTLWLAIIGIGCGLSGMWPLLASTALKEDDENSGTILSVVLLFGYFGSSVIPYLIGLIGEGAGMTPAILSTTIFFAMLGVTVKYLIPKSLIK